MIEGQTALHATVVMTVRRVTASPMNGLSFATLWQQRFCLIFLSAQFLTDQKLWCPYFTKKS